jgi:hypothetical protein
VLRLRVAEAGEAGERGSLLAAGVARDCELGAVGEPDAARVQPASEPLLHDRDQLDERPQAAVVLRLLRQMRKPTRQQPPHQTEELPVGADPDRRLRDRKRDQLGVARQRRPAPPSRDPTLISEDIRCNNKGFQIRHLELPSRGTQVWKPFAFSGRVPANPPEFHIKPLVGEAAVGSQPEHGRDQERQQHREDEAEAPDRTRLVGFR